jgi:2-oxoglutarate dehydrogenase E1 component
VAEDIAPDQVGPNAWLVDEMYEQFLADPGAVSESWREFFGDYRPERPVAAPRPADAPATPPAAVAPAPVAEGPAAAEAPAGEPLRGAAALIATNMTRSLEVPTATSFREVPAKLLEVNRSIINGYLGRTRGGKVSFTHLIGFAVVRAIADAMPVMNSTYVEGPDGKGRVVHHEHIGLGLAVDVEKQSGRTLLVPCIRDADTLDSSPPSSRAPTRLPWPRSACRRSSPSRRPTTTASSRAPSPACS